MWEVKGIIKKENNEIEIPLYENETKMFCEAYIADMQERGAEYIRYMIERSEE